MVGNHISYARYWPVCCHHGILVISEAKYDKITVQLSQPHAETNAVDSKLRWWIKRKRFQLFNFHEQDLINVLVIPKHCEFV